MNGMRSVLVTAGVLACVLVVWSGCADKKEPGKGPEAAKAEAEKAKAETPAETGKKPEGAEKAESKTPVIAESPAEQKVEERVDGAEAQELGVGAPVGNLAAGPGGAEVISGSARKLESAERMERAKATLFTIAKDVKIQIEFNPLHVA